MAKAENKTKPADQDPKAFIDAVEHPVRRADGLALLDLFGRVTGLAPRMWGPSIIGYGRYKYTYETGRTGEFLMTGFSPRKSNLSIYILPGYRYGEMQDMLSRLGKHKTGKSCLYINKLSDVDLGVLEDMVLEGVTYMKSNYETWDD